MSRKGFEFSQADKEEARRRWHEQNPGREDEELEIDHIIAVWFAKENGMAPDEVRTLQNARALPKDEHRARDHKDTSEMTAHLSNIARFVGRLFD